MSTSREERRMAVCRTGTREKDTRKKTGDMHREENTSHKNDNPEEPRVQGTDENTTNS